MLQIHSAAAYKIKEKIKEWIDGRAEAEAVEDGAYNSNHLLSSAHTHITVGVCASNGQLRYLEVKNANQLWQRMPAIKTTNITVFTRAYPALLAIFRGDLV